MYKDFRISQYHVVYALCAGSSNCKVSHCYITKIRKQASSLINCCLQILVPGLTTAHSFSCLSIPPPPLNLKLFWVTHLPLWVLPAPVKQILRSCQRSEEWPRSQHRWGMWALEDVSTPHPQQLFAAGATICCCAVPCRGAGGVGRGVCLHWHWVTWQQKSKACSARLWSTCYADSCPGGTLGSADHLHLVHWRWILKSFMAF